MLKITPFVLDIIDGGGRPLPPPDTTARTIGLIVAVVVIVAVAGLLIRYALRKKRK